MGENSSGLCAVLIVCKGEGDVGSKRCASASCVSADVEQSWSCIGTTKPEEASRDGFPQRHTLLSCWHSYAAGGNGQLAVITTSHFFMDKLGRDMGVQ